MKRHGLPALAVILCTWALVLGHATNVNMDCVHCNVLFSKVHYDYDTSSFNRVQRVEMQLRGNYLLSVPFRGLRLPCLWSFSKYSWPIPETLWAVVYRS